jgi:NAD(P)H-hydrate epimerase
MHFEVKNMKVANCTQMKQIDTKSINKYGIPGIVLMENAAISVVNETKTFLGDLEHRSIIVFCGKGNNGGDGYAIARHLFNNRANVLVIMISSKEEINGDALINLEIIEKLGVKIIYAQDKSYLEGIAASLYLCDLVIDAIFGTGIRGSIKGISKRIIELINSSGSNVISVDIPSGVNGDTGLISDVCIKADITVTFGLPKIGTICYPGAEYCGKLVVADISIPQNVIDNEGININLLDEKLIENMCPVRYNNSNKGDYGKIFIVAGSKGMTGAAVLASQAALKTGSGLVTVGIPETLNDVVEMKVTEVMSYQLKDTGNGILALESAHDILKKAENGDVLVYGPGLSKNKTIGDILEKIISNYSGPMVIDADGINALSSNINILEESISDIIITPHPGEMSRLTGYEIDYIQKNRLSVAYDFANKWKVTVVLKGARTVIACPDGEMFINTTGNPGMATAGMGDVLSGIIASLIGQGLSAKEASLFGVYIHGLSGDIGVKKIGPFGLTAADVIDRIPETLKKISGY